MTIPHLAYPRRTDSPRGLVFRSPTDVYAAQDATGGAIKVGISAFPELRAHNVFASKGAVEAPVLLVVWRSAGRRAERSLHQILAPWTTGENEWYEDCEAVRRVLAALALGRYGALGVKEGRLLQDRRAA